MAKKTSRILALTLILTLFAGLATQALAASAPEKEEAVYALLSHDGSAGSLYVVNSFELDEAGEITDYGDYGGVRNLSTTDTLAPQDGKLTVSAPAGRFSYQGNLESAELPWIIGITYSLDGQRIDPESLVGKSGEVEIRMDVGKNPAADDSFFPYFTLQISLNLDADRFTGIEADGGTVAAAGNDRTVTFTHLPGTEKSYTIKANAADFELEPIQFAGVRFSMDISLDGTADVSDQFTQLSDGIAELNDGARSLRDGSGEFASGLSQTADGVRSVSGGSKQIAAGISQSAGGLSQLLTQSEQLKALASALLASPDAQVQALAGGVLSQMEALSQIQAGLSALDARYSQFDAGIDGLSGGLSGLVSGYKDLSGGISQLADGTARLHEETANLGDEVQAKIDEMLASYTGSDYTPVSFVSDQNRDVKSVQFVLRTQAIRAEEPPAQEEEAPSLTFWQRLLKLFGLYRE